MYEVAIFFATCRVPHFQDALPEKHQGALTNMEDYKDGFYNHRSLICTLKGFFRCMSCVVQSKCARARVCVCVSLSDSVWESSLSWCPYRDWIQSCSHNLKLKFSRRKQPNPPIKKFFTARTECIKMSCMTTRSLPVQPFCSCKTNDKHSFPVQNHTKSWKFPWWVSSCSSPRSVQLPSNSAASEGWSRTAYSGCFDRNKVMGLLGISAIRSY